MEDESFLSFRDVSKSFGSVLAVDRVSIDVKRGEFFSLLGASGCGKTTLLRMLAGLEFPTSGEIMIDGQPMSSVAPNHRPVGMVFQNYAIFPHLNVRQNIGYSLRRERLPKAQFDAKVGEMLELIKLPGYENRAAHELSGGERQRVALARALISRPKVLLLDEPLGALDKQLREQMQLELRELQRSVGITFVFVTHDQEEALTMSDRIAVMSGGRVLQIATPKDLYDRPANVEVAGFIGKMNFFDARISEVSREKVVLESAGLGRVTAPPSNEILKEGDRLIVAIRPEKLLLSGERQGAGENSVEGVIETAAYLGDRSHIHVALEGCAEPVAVAAQEMPTASGQALDSGCPVWLSWAAGSLVLLARA